MKPPFKITNKIIEYISEISEITSKITLTSNLNKNPLLRRKNRISTIYSSLAIEQNTLTLEQVTDVIDGKRVIAPPKDIVEVKNVYEVYEDLDSLNPYSIDDLLKAHGVVTRGLIDESGEFRSKSVGVVDSNTGRVIHFGTLPNYVPNAVGDLLEWVKSSDVHPLIKGCVFHYEFEIIHPFSDGNGRVGRLWHTLLLYNWNEIFAWIPVETMIQKRQSEYYQVLNNCNICADDTEFIEFMLETIKMVLFEIYETCTPETSQVQFEKLIDFCKIPRTRIEMQEFIGIEGRKKFNENYLKPLLKQGKIVMTIPDKPNSSKQKYRKI